MLLGILHVLFNCLGEGGAYINQHPTLRQKQRWLYPDFPTCDNSNPS